MREAIHYALAAAKWFEIEARKCDSVENLWSDFQFMLLKLNFVRANLTLPDGRREWNRNNMLGPLVSLEWSGHKFSLGEASTLDLAVESDALNPTLVRHLCEITVEAWQKSATTWCKRHMLPLQFNSRILHGASRKSNQNGLAYVPVALDQSASRQPPSSALDSTRQMQLF
jgi:hypothetical protein